MKEKNNNKRTSSYKWLLLILLLIIIVVVTVILNLSRGEQKSHSPIEVDDGDESINWGRFTEKEIELTETLEIAQPGIYHLKGKLENGAVNIKVSKEDPVKLILDNVSIKNNVGPAISCFEADDLVIELIGNNNLEDGTNYETEDEDVRGVIYSKADLTIDGQGTLNLKANFEDGIVSKDDLKIIDGTYNLESNDDAIRGKDSVHILGGSFMIKSTMSAIKSTNETETGKGFVFIKNGTFFIEAGDKGIEAPNNVYIYGGELHINSFDDSIHSNDTVLIAGGEIEMISGDDGVHADNKLTIRNGVISVLQGYEGLEAKEINISRGDINIFVSDDGINAGGGADSSSYLNRPDSDSFNTNSECSITIDGGNIYIDSAGDGIDSNGYLTINGGQVIIDGPSKDDNGALDSTMGITMNGGEVLAIGAAGMAENLGENSKIYNISVFLDKQQPERTVVEIKNDQNETIFSHTSTREFQHIAAGSEKLIPGVVYTVYLNGEKNESFTISNIVTTVGNSYDIMKQRR